MQQIRQIQRFGAFSVWDFMKKILNNNILGTILRECFKIIFKWKNNSFCPKSNFKTGSHK
jgi:hypothetical protein